jgi:hypothetical protein
MKACRGLLIVAQRVVAKVHRSPPPKRPRSDHQCALITSIIVPPAVGSLVGAYLCCEFSRGAFSFSDYPYATIGAEVDTLPDGRHTARVLWVHRLREQLFDAEDALL